MSSTISSSLRACLIRYAAEFDHAALCNSHSTRLRLYKRWRCLVPRRVAYEDREVLLSHQRHAMECAFESRHEENVYYATATGTISTKHYIFDAGMWSRKR